MSKRRDRRVTNVRDVIHTEVTTDSWDGTFKLTVYGKSRDGEVTYEHNITLREAILPYFLRELRKVVKAQRDRLRDVEEAFRAEERS